MHPASDLFTALRPDAGRWTPGFGEARQAGYASLRAPATEAERFCAWRGRSNSRYVTSIYSFEDCPDYEHVVALAVRRAADGSRKVVAGVDLGAFPLVALNGATMQAAREQGANEVHLHLLADTADARAAAIDDLA